MKLIKSEYQFIIAVLLFLASYVLDWINGAVPLKIKSPYQFIQSEILAKYPFTAVSVLIKVLAIWISIMLVLSLIQKRYISKSIVIIVLGILGQLFAIQQFATGVRVTTAEWTLGICFSGVSLLITAPILLILGMFHGIRTKPKQYSIDESTPTPQPSNSKKKKFEFGID